MIFNFSNFIPYTATLPSLLTWNDPDGEQTSLVKGPLNNFKTLAWRFRFEKDAYSSRNRNLLQNYLHAASTRKGGRRKRRIMCNVDNKKKKKGKKYAKDDTQDSRELCGIFLGLYRLTSSCCVRLRRKTTISRIFFFSVDMESVYRTFHRFFFLFFL